MKTTIEMADGLLAEARRVAAAEGTTLRALLEEGLRASLRLRSVPTRFHLREVSFRGDGLQETVEDGDWTRICAAAYEGRGA